MVDMATPFSCLLIFILCFSLHGSSNARCLGATGKKCEMSPHKKNLYARNELEEKIPRPPVKQVKSNSSNDQQEATATKLDADIHHENQVSRVGQKQKKNPYKDVAKPNNVVYDQSHVSISWRLPKKKRGEKHPGYNLDYSPPKTHPPSHN